MTPPSSLGASSEHLERGSEPDRGSLAPFGDLRPLPPDWISSGLLWTPLDSSGELNLTRYTVLTQRLTQRTRAVSRSCRRVARAPLRGSRVSQSCSSPHAESTAQSPLPPLNKCPKSTSSPPRRYQPTASTLTELVRHPLSLPRLQADRSQRWPFPPTPTRSRSSPRLPLAGSSQIPSPR